MGDRDIDKMVEGLQSGRLSRGDFMRRAAALGVSMSAIGAILAASGTGASAATRSRSAGHSSSSTAQVSFLNPGNPYPKETEVLNAVDKKLHKDGVNADFSLIRVPWDQWDQKSSLMIATGQPVGLIQVMQDLKTVGQLYGNHELRSLNSYLKKYPDLIKKFPPGFWNEVTVDDKILAIPAWTTNKDDKEYGEIFYRKDVLDKLHLRVPRTVDEVIHTGLQIQKEIYKETGQKAYAWQPIDRPAKWLERTYPSWPFFVDTTPGVVMVTQDGQVHSWLESREFKQDCQVYAKMNQAGLIYPNLLAAPHDFSNNQGIYGIYVWGFESFDYQSNYVNLKQHNPKAVMGSFFLDPGKGNFQYFYTYNANAVPVTAKDPEAGIAFLDWLYRSKTNHDLFNYGIEGVTYTNPSRNPYRYRPILGANGQPVYESDDWMWMISYVWYRRFQDNIPNFIVNQQKYPAKGKVTVSPVAGFEFNVAPVAQIAANLGQIVQTEIWPIKYGFQPYDQALPKAVKHLKAAGLDHYLAEYRRQLSKFEAYKKAHPHSIAYELIGEGKGKSSKKGTSRK